MTHARRISKAGGVLAAVMLAASVASAQPADQTASAFYTAYRAAFQKATKVDDILPFMSKSQKAQIEKTPAGERAKMFEMIKSFDTYTNVKVIKETKTATGATLNVEGIDGDKKKATATVDIVKEDGAWKLSKESWSS